METAIVKSEGGQVVPVQSGGDAYLTVIAAAARDPQVDINKMQALLEMAERVKKYDAEVAFNCAMKTAQNEILPVVRDAENSHTRSRYARLETIDARIRPIYTKHGFSLSFNTGEPRGKDAVRVICDVRHEAGHMKTYELEGDLDVAGAKGTSNKTSIQGLGSSVSYLRRYLTLMVFNVTLTNEDNDGQGALTEQQKENLINMAAACEMSPDERQRFINLIGTDKLENLAPHRYEDVLEALRKKARLKQQGGGR